MKIYQTAFILLASTAMTACTVDTVTYSPGYMDTVVYTPGYVDAVYANDNYGTYPSYYWGYQTYYAPVYSVGAYRGWDSGYYYDHGVLVRP